MGSCFTGAIAYADDITLSTSCNLALAIMVEVCESYANEFAITFRVIFGRVIIFYCQILVIYVYSL